MVKFSKSLSFGIGAACFSSMLLLSSCSKEDMQVPQPESAVLNEGSNLKTNLIGSAYGLTPASITSTDSPTGFHVYQSGWNWYEIDGGPATLSREEEKKLAPMGTSTVDYVWGNPSLPWIKKLDAPENPGILTIIDQKGFEKYGSESSAVTKIKHLIPGKKYALTFQVATTIRNTPKGITQYAPNATVAIGGVKNGNKGLNDVQDVVIDFTGQEAKWITKTIVFEAAKTEADFIFSTNDSNEYWNSHSKFYNYAHISIGKNALQLIEE